MLIVVLVFLVEVDFVVVDNYEVLILVELILVLSLLDRAGIGWSSGLIAVLKVVLNVIIELNVQLLPDHISDFVCS